LNPSKNSTKCSEKKGYKVFEFIISTSKLLRTYYAPKTELAEIIVFPPSIWVSEHNFEQEGKGRK